MQRVGTVVLPPRVERNTKRRNGSIIHTIERKLTGKTAVTRDLDCILTALGSNASVPSAAPLASIRCLQLEACLLSSIHAMPDSRSWASQRGGARGREGRQACYASKAKRAFPPLHPSISRRYLGTYLGR